MVQALFMGLSKHSNVEMGTLCLVKKFCIVQRRERGMLAFPFVLEVTNLLPHALELLYIQMLTFYCHMKTVARSNYWKQSKTCLFFFFQNALLYLRPYHMVTSMVQDLCKVLFSDLVASLVTLLLVKTICNAPKREVGMPAFLFALKVLKFYVLWIVRPYTKAKMVDFASIMNVKVVTQGKRVFVTLKPRNSERRRLRFLPTQFLTIHQKVFSCKLISFNGNSSIEVPSNKPPSKACIR